MVRKLGTFGLADFTLYGSTTARSAQLFGCHLFIVQVAAHWNATPQKTWQT